MILENSYLQLPSCFYADSLPAEFPHPQLLKFNRELALDLGFNSDTMPETEILNLFIAPKLPAGVKSIALAYAGHQFGHFVPLLGDGRAILVGEIINSKGQRFDLQLKGSGTTVFSRNGDGRAALGPVLREYIVSEAMHRLGIKTTRTLAAISTGEDVYRESTLPGALLARVASSHIRFGTFQYIAAREDLNGLCSLLNYSIQRHYPEVKNTDQPALNFFRKVSKAQIDLVTDWMSVGFIHGVMNTDNMTISGETIDYGPCAFMDQYNFYQCYSYIDRQGRYAYANQGPILHWNLARLAECLSPLIDKDQNKSKDILNQELEENQRWFNHVLNKKMAKKIGIQNYRDGDDELINFWLNFLQENHQDFTLSFRLLSNILTKQPDSQEIKRLPGFSLFEEKWKDRLNEEAHSYQDLAILMNKVNPCYIPRNHQIQRAIEHALNGDLTIFHSLNQALLYPYDEKPSHHQHHIFKNPPLPEEIVSATFCGT